MESILWACDLLVLLFLCRWALRTDIAETEAKSPLKQTGQN